jgi:LDH2 family malate/lactate/ureidoglycolate dehydrogenase
MDRFGLLPSTIFLNLFYGIPLILDMATTSIPYGKVVLAKTEGKPIPPDWGFDEDRGRKTAI